MRHIILTIVAGFVLIGVGFAAEPKPGAEEPLGSILKKANPTSRKLTDALVAWKLQEGKEFILPAVWDVQAGHYGDVRNPSSVVKVLYVKGTDSTLFIFAEESPKISSLTGEARDIFELYETNKNDKNRSLSGRGKTDDTAYVSIGSIDGVTKTYIIRTWIKPVSSSPTSTGHLIIACGVLHQASANWNLAFTLNVPSIRQP